MSVYRLDGQTNFEAVEIFALLSGETDLPWISGGCRLIVLGCDDEKGLWWGRSGERFICLKIFPHPFSGKDLAPLMEELQSFEKREGLPYAFYVLFPEQNGFSPPGEERMPAEIHFYEFTCLYRMEEKAIALKPLAAQSRPKLPEKQAEPAPAAVQSGEVPMETALLREELSDFIDFGVELHRRFGSGRKIDLPEYSHF